MTTTIDLSRRILEMGKTGVYRESIFEALQSLATKKQISAAIAHAKLHGLRSVASLRDETLGTYYELDLAQYQTAQKHLEATAPLVSTADAVTQLAESSRTLKKMLAIARLLTAGLGLSGMGLLMAGQPHWGSSLLISATGAAIVWGMQNTLARSSRAIVPTGKKLADK